MDILDELFEVIKDRKKNPRENSYTSSLMKEGKSKIVSKLGEEFIELISAAYGDGDLVHECSDLLYHLLVLLAYCNVEWRDVKEELERRRR